MGQGIDRHVLIKTESPDGSRGLQRTTHAHLSAGVCKVQSGQPHPSYVHEPSAPKLCRKCGQAKRLAFFPRDRSRPDGRWHTCSACNRRWWKEVGKPRAARRRWQTASSNGTGLSGLRQYRNRSGERFSNLPPDLRWKAERLLAKYMTRHRWHMTPTRYAALIACAASNVRRVGDRSWARSLWRLKGYRRAERRKAVGAAQLDEIRRRNAGRSRVAYLSLD